MSPYRVAGRVLVEVSDPSSAWRPMIGMLLVGFMAGLSLAFIWASNPDPKMPCRDETHRLAIIAWATSACSHENHRGTVVSDGSLLVCACGRMP